MSVKANNWVWQESPREIGGVPFNGNPFTVLQALADIADDDGNVIYADAAGRTQDALAWKARVSLRTFQRALALLTDAGLVTVTLTGRENSYKINMDLSTGQNTRQVDVFITPGGKDVRLSKDVTGGGSGTPTVADHRNVLTDDFKDQSSLTPTTGAAALRADDEDVPPRLGIRDRIRLGDSRRHLNVDAAAAALGKYFTHVAGGENERRLVYQVALRILGKAAKAKTSVADPTRYVIAAVEAEPEVWIKAAFAMDVRP